MKDNEKLTDQNATQEASLSGEWRNFTEMKKYIRANKYDYNWLKDNWMGPNPLYLAEELCANMDLRPGMKVLDMGCGKGCSSVFLAKEYGVTVFASDLWISATDNYKRFVEMGVSDRVFLIHAEAHTLPYAEEFFDAIISIDSYHYYWTNDIFLHDFVKYLKPGGQIGIVVPGLKHEIGNNVPENIREYWDEGFCALHSPKWWEEHFKKCKSVKVDVADSPDDGWEIWLKWEILSKKYNNGNNDRYISLLEIDQGKTITFSRVISTKM